MNSTIKKYRIRREKRIKTRMDADDGKWVTTKNGNRIHISEDNVIDKGNPYVVAGAGAPKEPLPEGKIKLSSKKVNFPDVMDDAMVDAIKGRKSKDCILGGFYRVVNSQSESQESDMLKTETFFNPYTGQHFEFVTRDANPDTRDELYGTRKGAKELRAIPINEKVQNLWDRANGRIHKGADVVVNKGRTIPIGTKAKVVEIFPFKGASKHTVAYYAKLDNGEKINVGNLVYAEDYKGREKEAGKLKFKDAAEMTKMPITRQIASSVVSDTDYLAEVIKGKKTKDDVLKALKASPFSYSVNKSSDNFEVTVRENDDKNSGGIRIYQKGTGDSAKFVIDGGKKPATRASNADIEKARTSISDFVQSKLGKGSTKNVSFDKLKTDDDKYNFVLLATFTFATQVAGFGEDVALRKAVQNADALKKNGYNGLMNAKLTISR